MLELSQPTRVYLDSSIPVEDARKFLTYRDTAIEFELRKFRNNRWLAQKLTSEEWNERLLALEEQKTQCLLKSDEEGRSYTLSGLAGHLADFFRVKVSNTITYPEAQRIPWLEIPPELRPYQTQIVSALLSERHGAVSVATGLGKSFCILHLCKMLGLKAVVMAPLKAIAEQLYADFSKYLGPKYVGFYGDGKKECKRLITIAIGQSLARVETDSVAHAEFSKVQVFIADESHQTPAATLTKVCLGLFSGAPYRFFFSGTQTRNDGAELLLKGIIGPIVYTMDLQAGVDGGYLAKPLFHFYKTTSPSRIKRDADPIEATREHLFKNQNVNRIAASIANASVKLNKASVLILIDEVSQFAKLLPLLRHEVGFAHGGLTKDNRGEVPADYHKSDPRVLVQRFNNLELPILVGTSCISTGTDIKAAKVLIYLKGGKSEIELFQSMGRGTRLFEKGDYKKTTFHFVDFLVEDIESLARHAKIRAKLCAEAYPGPVRIIDV